MSALTTVLILPDICGKAEYPQQSNSRRYKDWLRNYAGLNYDNLITVDEIYKLRNSMLHQGTPTTKKQGENIDEFELLIQSPLKASKTMQAIYHTPTKRILSVNIESLCEIICTAASKYFADSKDKFDFINYRLVNTEYSTAKAFGLTDDAVKVKL